MRDPATITIVHTNDTHGRMRPPVSDRLSEVLYEHPGALFLDAGDTISAGNLGFRVGGEPALEILSDLADMTGVELLVIDAGTNLRDFAKEIRWNQAYHRLAAGL